jgi:hypothetical protein
VAYYFPPAPVLRKPHIIHLRRHLIATQNDHHFAKTGSGQTQGKHSKTDIHMPFTQVLSYVLIIIVGSVLALLKMPILLWPGLFLIFFANGAGRLPGLSSPFFVWKHRSLAKTGSGQT